MKRLVLFLFLATLVFAQSAPEVEITAEPDHHLVFANDQVRVFSVEVAPHTETLMHWHRHDYIYVAIGAVEIVNNVKGKDPVTGKLADGQTGFAAGPFAHMVRDSSEQPFRNVTVELLQDEKLRKIATTSEAARGLEILQGGTKEILFVKDGVRASEIELQPGGAMPGHRGGPILIVAVSDLQLQSKGTGKTMAMNSMKAGESKWLADRDFHAITNAGHQMDKFVTLEFPQE